MLSLPPTSFVADKPANIHVWEVVATQDLEVEIAKTTRSGVDPFVRVFFTLSLNLLLRHPGSIIDPFRVRAWTNFVLHMRGAFIVLGKHKRC